MHETAAEQKESRSPETPADIVILFILMRRNLPLIPELIAAISPTMTRKCWRN
jgi:hypothetical protein